MFLFSPKGGCSCGPDTTVQYILYIYEYKCFCLPQVRRVNMFTVGNDYCAYREGGRGGGGEGGGTGGGQTRHKYNH